MFIVKCILIFKVLDNLYLADLRPSRQINVTKIEYFIFISVIYLINDMFYVENFYRKIMKTCRTKWYNPHFYCIIVLCLADICIKPIFSIICQEIAYNFY